MGGSALRGMAFAKPTVVVGTGGSSVRTFPVVRPHTEVRDRTSLGILELTLGAGAYGWRFRPAVGSFTDAGSDRCH